MLTVELTDEERQLLVQVLSSVPIQGNLQTLPQTMTTLANLLKKFKPEELLPPAPPPDKGVKALRKWVKK